MPPTDVKTYSPGAEKAARAINKAFVVAYEGMVPGGLPRIDIAEIISRETHDTEMLEELKTLVDLLELDDEATHPGTDTWVALKRAEILIEKAEGSNAAD